MNSTTELFRKTQEIEAEFQEAVRQFDSAESDPDNELYDRVLFLQREYEQTHRELRKMWGDNMKGERERINIDPSRCHAQVGWGRQCSRKATTYLNDYGVCTQHYKLINFGTGLYPDLFDLDGKGYAGHGVLEHYPRPFFWEHRPN